MEAGAGGELGAGGRAGGGEALEEAEAVTEGGEEGGGPASGVVEHLGDEGVGLGFVEGLGHKRGSSWGIRAGGGRPGHLA